MKTPHPEDQMEDKEKLYEAWVNSIPFWESYGQTLKRVADKVYKTSTLGGNEIYMMLIGFSFENFLKGILICNDLKNVDDRIKTLKNWKGLGHDLFELVENCKIKVNDEEKSLLERLTIFSIWRGRYPVPIEPKDLPRLIKDPSGTLIPNVYIKTGDIQLIEDLFTRIKYSLDQKIEETKTIRENIRYPTTS